MVIAQKLRLIVGSKIIWFDIHLLRSDWKAVRCHLYHHAVIIHNFVLFSAVLNKMTGKHCFFSIGPNLGELVRANCQLRFHCYFQGSSVLMARGCWPADYPWAKLLRLAESSKTGSVPKED